MIVDALLFLARGIIVPLIGLLPDSDGALTVPDGSTIAGTMGSWIGPFDRFAPIHEGCAMLEFVIVYLFPASFVYAVACYVWARIPFIGK